MDTSIKKQLEETYDKYAIYINKSIMEKWRIKLRNNIFKTFLEYHVETVLDMGCGCGMDSKFFADKGFQLTCVDLSEKLVEICKKKGLNAIKMDYFDLDSLTEQFDCVYAQNSLLHVPKKDFDIILKKIHGCLKPGGIVYIGMFGGIDKEGIYKNDIFNPPRFFTAYSDQSIIEKVSMFFKVLSFETKKMDKNEFHHQSIFLKKLNN